MDAQSIIAEIERLVGDGPYDQWTIGVTDNPRRRREEHEEDGKHVSRWSGWGADSEKDARDVEWHFTVLGMGGGTGGQGQAGYVYVFQDAGP